MKIPLKIQWSRYEFIGLGLLFAFAVFLRFYRIDDNFPFVGEVGHNLLAIKDAIDGKYIPLIGPPTSHPWLYFGPWFYWIYGPILFLSQYNPLSYAYFGAVMSLLLIPVNYYVARKLFDPITAVISTLLISISPLYLFFSWGARFFAIVPLLSLVFLLYQHKIITDKKPYLFPVGLIFGFMFSLHYTPLMLMPFLVLVLIYKKIKIRLIDGALFITGILLPNVSLVFYDLTHGTNMVKNLMLWIPYRIAGFLGLIPKNTVSTEVAVENVNSIWKFFQLIFFPESYGYLSLMIWFLILAGSILMVYIYIKRGQNEMYFFLLILLFIGISALFIHGNPPLHYFVPILPLPVLLFARLLSYVWGNSIGKLLVLSVMVLFLVLNMQFYFSKQWAYREKVAGIIPYNFQQQAAKGIIADAQGEAFQLRRVGPDDQFEGDYAQNYQYLLWWYGNEPVSNADTIYTIYEHDFPDVSEEKNVYNSEHVVIIKHEN